MLAFAAEAIAALMLAPHGLWKADILFWSWFLGLAMLVTPLLWMVFVVSFLSDGDHHRPSLRSRLIRSEEHTSELQSQSNLVCRLLLEKKKKQTSTSC